MWCGEMVVQCGVVVTDILALNIFVWVLKNVTKRLESVSKLARLLLHFMLLPNTYN